MTLKKQVWVAMATIIAHMSLCLPTATAQYDGSFDAIYFNRTFSPKSEALGRSGVAVLDDALSLQTNSSLVGHMSGYSLSYSYSNPYYFLENGTYQFFGLSAPIGQRMAIGFSEARMRWDESTLDRFRTVSFIFKPIRSTAISVDARNFSVRYEIPLGVSGPVIEADQWYLSLNASYAGSYSSPISDDTKFIGGVRIENVFRNELKISNTVIELPQIVTVGFSNTMTVYQRPDQEWSRYVDVTLVAEYSDVLNSDYNSRFSVGTEMDYSGLIKARIGYFYNSTYDFGVQQNKSALSELTYGAGFVFPISKLMTLDSSIDLEIDFSRMQQPQFTKGNNSAIGAFTMLSASLRVEL